MEGCKALFGEAFNEAEFNEAKDEEGFAVSTKIWVRTVAYVDCPLSSWISPALSLTWRIFSCMQEALSAASSEEQPFDFLKFRSGLPDCCTAKPGDYKVASENVTGRLVEVALKAGDECPPHDHPKHYMYFVAGGKLTITDYATEQAGESQTAEIPAGAPPIFPAGDTFTLAAVCVARFRRLMI